MFGGFCSIILRVTIFAFAVQKFLACFLRTQNTIIETANYVKFPSEYPLKDSDFYFYSQVLNKDFDNDNNPYMKMHLYIYTHEGTVNVPLKEC